ncbi:flavin-binding monooxygenase-like protein [Moniliophthora roreri MCA 2997]|uniref:Flavin-binding monooxygenase-like protein n=1 Tax=Moniliophthora roreri (strain MCA 2997) TaxID=1381753 RepID=V2XEN6_MONRO|nr:flavin-binding monooxygenase-like protein [Moniliophthora roreri MCA 2997]
MEWTWNPLLLAYQIIQILLSKLFSPAPPPPHAERCQRPRIAVIGAGLTGVSSAAHCIGHGFDVVMFESGGPDELGGIWARVNNTSGLQIHSLMYRFHPRVQWQSGYPSKQQILDAVQDIWKAYLLEDKTKFNTKIERVWQDEDGKWYLNSEEYGKFDGIIAAIGTCGEPKMPHIAGQESFKGEIYHSSKLDGKDAKGKKVVIIGGGASAVEALEFVTAAQAGKTTILARSDKWIIPRNAIVDMLLAMNIFGQETYLSWIPEFLLRRFFYRNLADLAPSHQGIFTETPMVNSDVLNKIRDGSAEWLRGDIDSFTENGVLFNKRAKNVPKGGPGREILVEADMVIMATGFKRPKLDFLPDNCFDEPYNPPSWYLQTFPPPYPSVSCINCTYINAIGTVGNYHIGIYTRILLMFLVDPLTRPHEWLMKKWIDMTRLLKARSPTPAFDFFTYTELLWWYFFCVAINPFRWKWALFVFFGIGRDLPLSIVQKEEKIRQYLGQDNDKEEITKKKTA